jgi:threonine/homoserine/homoserine lactone efflux protein
MSILGSSPTGPEPSRGRDVWIGLGLGLAINASVFVVGIFLVLSGVPLVQWVLATLGVTQFVYIGPLMLEARRSERRGKMLGLIIAASVTVLLNAACASSFWW